jgi:hypothetical protein
VNERHRRTVKSDRHFRAYRALSPCISIIFNWSSDRDLVFVRVSVPAPPQTRSPRNVAFLVDLMNELAKKVSITSASSATLGPIAKLERTTLSGKEL